MQYPPVKHSHIVPAGYLRAWAHDEQIAMRRVGSAKSVVVGVRNAGVRSNFYRRQRPRTGETFYDVEWSLAQGENVALPVIATLADRWPVSLEDKGKVAELLALQHVRGPTFKAWHESYVAAEAALLREDAKARVTPPPGVSRDEAIEQVATARLSDTDRMKRMFQALRAVSILLGSMHWSLVTCSHARLVTSDHPVVVWPLRRGRVRPCPNDLDAGVQDTLEIFVPVSRNLLLLLTWLDHEDASHPITGTGRQIATANSFVIANADAQWFHEPGVEPWIASGPRTPLSADLIRGYGPDAVERSLRRAEAMRQARDRLRKPLSNEPLSVAPATSRGQGER